ncbi:hypothetical protein BH23CHL7_BH23CHL7_15380 [soil metagenome]
MARAKNTSRATARRRTRAATREEIEASELDEEAGDEGAAPAAEPRRPMFKMPDVREDLRLLPQILTSRRLMILPPLMLVVGFVLTYLLAIGALPEGVVDIAWMYIYVFFVPPALLTYFIGGFLAKRASYLVGLLLGLLSGALLSLLLFTTTVGYGVGEGGETGLVIVPDEARLTFALGYLGTGALYGTFAAAFAAWYRDFLRRMQEQGRARRAGREAQERVKRRDQRQEERKATRRPSR